jgi:phosphate transport system protein
MTKSHTNRQYEHELNALRTRLVDMTEHVQSMVAKSTAAFMAGDVELAEKTLLMDRQTNSDEVEIDEACLVLLAKRQPLGADLRFITIVLKMVTDLERIGDLAVHVCELVALQKKYPGLRAHPQIPVMASAIEGMLKDCMTALTNQDAELAELVIRNDDRVDDAYHTMLRDLSNLMAGGDKSLTEGIILLQSVGKWLERAGDHCTNVAELIVFLLKGRDIRHLGKLAQIKNSRFETIH